MYGYRGVSLCLRSCFSEFVHLKINNHFKALKIQLFLTEVPQTAITQTFQPFFFFVFTYVYFPFEFTFPGLTKGKFLNISLFCLVLNLVIFVRRRTR